jgi:uncharacterized protein
VIFVDTSALYAVLDRDEARHGEASQKWNQLLSSRAQLITHNYVLLEVAALAQHRLGLGAVQALEEALVPVLRIHWIAEQAHRIAMQMMLAAGRRKLSVVDCASFYLMRELGIREAFAFDRHFLEQGFSIV